MLPATIGTLAAARHTDDLPNPSRSAGAVQEVQIRGLGMPCGECPGAQPLQQAVRPAFAEHGAPSRPGRETTDCTQRPRTDGMRLSATYREDMPSSMRDRSGRDANRTPMRRAIGDGARSSRLEHVLRELRRRSRRSQLAGGGRARAPLAGTLRGSERERSETKMTLGHETR
jgi:hypothetical protein